MTKEPSRNEHLKEASRYLRGTIREGLAEEITGAISEDDQQLVKFHGMYLQDDRDLRPERSRPPQLTQVLQRRQLDGRLVQRRHQSDSASNDSSRSSSGISPHSWTQTAPCGERIIW